MGAPMVDDGQLYSFFKEYRADIQAGRKTPTSFGNNPKSTLIEDTSGMRQDPSASVRGEPSSPYEIDDDKSFFLSSRYLNNININILINAVFYSDHISSILHSITLV